jgi:hypothetical protein
MQLSRNARRSDRLSNATLAVSSAGIFSKGQAFVNLTSTQPITTPFAGFAGGGGQSPACAGRGQLGRVGPSWDGTPNLGSCCYPLTANNLCLRVMVQLRVGLHHG